MFSCGGDGRHQVEGLEHEPDVVAPQDRELVVVEGAEVGVADEGLPGGEAVQAGHAVQQRGLARAGRAHDRGEAPGGELDRDAVEGAHLGLALAVDLDRVDGPGRGLLCHVRRDGCGDGGHDVLPSAHGRSVWRPRSLDRGPRRYARAALGCGHRQPGARAQCQGPQARGEGPYSGLLRCPSLERRWSADPGPDRRRITGGTKTGRERTRLAQTDEVGAVAGGTRCRPGAPGCSAGAARVAAARACAGRSSRSRPCGQAWSSSTSSSCCARSPARPACPSPTHRPDYSVPAFLAARLAKGRPPDVAFLPQPGLLRRYAAEHLLVPLDRRRGQCRGQQLQPGLAPARVGRRQALRSLVQGRQQVPDLVQRGRLRAGGRGPAGWRRRARLAGAPARTVGDARVLGRRPGRLDAGRLVLEPLPAAGRARSVRPPGGTRDPVD